MNSKKYFAFLIILFLIFCNKSATSQEEFGDIGKPDDYEKTLMTSAQINYRSLVYFPTTFDWRDYGVVTPAKNQGSMGSCWAFATVGVIESRVEMERLGFLKSEWTNFSEQQLINCVALTSPIVYSFPGSMSSLRFYFIRGPMSETCAPYKEKRGFCFSLRNCHKSEFRITKYYTVDTNNINDVRSSIFNDGPAYFRFDVWDDFRDFWGNAVAGEVYSNKKKSGSKGGHAVLIIGWDDEKQAWLCRNSWGLSGPEGDGTFWISYQDHLNNLNFGIANVQSNGEGLDYEDILNFPFFCTATNVISKQQSLLSIILKLVL